jgi:hypothetical protein
MYPLSSSKDAFSALDQLWWAYWALYMHCCNPIFIPSHEVNYNKIRSLEHDLYLYNQMMYMYGGRTRKSTRPKNHTLTMSSQG